MRGVVMRRRGWAELLTNENEGQLFVVALVAGEVNLAFPKTSMTESQARETEITMAAGAARQVARTRFTEGRVRGDWLDRGPGALPRTVWGDRGDAVAGWGRAGADDGATPRIVMTPTASNALSPRKLLHTKWTAVEPRDKEKHFLVTKIIEPEPTGAPVVSVEIEAVHSKRARIIAWRELTNATQWRRGWV